jgi:sugar/nucleoside kinase (ribokinase family)
MYDVIGISHPLVDICTSVEEDFLNKFNLPKSQCTLVDEKTFKEILSNIDKTNSEIKLGGTVSNTLSALNLLGIKVGEYGKIGKDEYGELIKKENNDKMIGNFLSEDNLPTGTVLNFITPDAQRTFVVYLGAATQLTENDISEEYIKKAKIIHFTGYEFESLKVKSAIEKAVKIAKKNGILISFDLADPGVIQRNIIELKSFINDNVDILFANEEEAMEFTGKTPEKAVELLGEKVKYAIVKMGEKGSIIKIAHSGNTFKIEPYKTNAIDTTGAGDIYSAGILFGILKNLEMEKTGKIASYISSKVVEKIGARLNKINISHILNE